MTELLSPTMTSTQAAQFACDLVSEAKASILRNGISDPKTIFAICNKLSSILNLDLDFIVLIIESTELDKAN
jgi:hypothetical protein